MSAGPTGVSKVEKLAYVLVVAARKPRPYFEAHPITVLSDLPLKEVIAKIDTSGRLLPLKHRP